MKRYASIWLMDWPITAWRWARSTPNPAKTAPPETAFARPDSPTPFALIERTTAGLILHALTPAARARGLRLNQSHADACAIVPDLVSAPAEPERAFRALCRLAGWMERFSPFVALDSRHDGLEGLFIDLTGGQHLFGGEPAMVEQMLAGLQRLGAPARIGVADTPGAAWALARHGAHRIALAPIGETAAALAALPVSALRIAPKAVQLLGRFGLRRIGALTLLPRAALARRFRDAEALDVLERLDQALGHAAEPLIPVTAPSRYRVQSVFAEPMTNLDALALEAAALCDGLACALEQASVGARRLLLTGFRVDGRTTSLAVALAAPSYRAQHLLRLLKDKGFEHLDLGFGIDALVLSAGVTEPVMLKQTTTLAETDRDFTEARDALVDRLSARLGAHAVLSPRLKQSWLPEVAETLAPYAYRTSSAPDPPVGERPLLLFDPPESIQAVAEYPDGAPARFVWRRASHRVTRAAGPERLSPEWWRGADLRLPYRLRDYYSVEDEQGGRYWLFREGLYAPPEPDVACALLTSQKQRRGDAKPLPPAEPEPPARWWMHGLLP